MYQTTACEFLYVQVVEHSQDVYKLYSRVMVKLSTGKFQP